MSTATLNSESLHLHVFFSSHFSSGRLTSHVCVVIAIGVHANVSVKASPPGKSTRVKPSLALECPPPDIASGGRYNDGFISPALIPIPSPVTQNSGSVPPPGTTQPFQWTVNSASKAPNMLLSPLPWNSGNSIPKAPHLSECKAHFSPLPLTPGGDHTKEPSVFEQMQDQYLRNRADGAEFTPSPEVSLHAIVCVERGNKVYLFKFVSSG